MSAWHASLSLCMCVCVYMCVFRTSHKTFCHTFTPIDTEGDRSCHRKGARSVRALTFGRYGEQTDTRTGGRGTTHTHTHTLPLSADVAGQKKGVSILCFHTDDTSVKPRRSHTQDKSRHTLVHKPLKTPIHLKPTYPNTHTHTAAPIMKAFLCVPFPSHLAPPFPIISGHHCL